MTRSVCHNGISILSDFLGPRSGVPLQYFAKPAKAILHTLKSHRK